MGTCGAREATDGFGVGWGFLFCELKISFRYHFWHRLIQCHSNVRLGWKPKFRRVNMIGISCIHVTAPAGNSRRSDCNFFMLMDDSSCRGGPCRRAPMLVTASDDSRVCVAEWAMATFLKGWFLSWSFPFLCKRIPCFYTPKSRKSSGNWTKTSHETTKLLFITFPIINALKTLDFTVFCNFHTGRKKIANIEFHVVLHWFWCHCNKNVATCICEKLGTFVAKITVFDAVASLDMQKYCSLRCFRNLVSKGVLPTGSHAMCSPTSRLYPLVTWGCPGYPMHGLQMFHPVLNKLKEYPQQRGLTLGKPCKEKAASPRQAQEPWGILPKNLNLWET